jgi:hypothetical protein
MSRELVFDIETDGIQATKIHCLSYCDLHTEVLLSITSYEDMIQLLSDPTITLIGHNICRYDIPTLERLLGIKIKAKLIDTLALSWTLYPQQKLHGLAEWGEIFGIPKPKVNDWENLDISVYIHRCEEDVKINMQLWNKLRNYLFNLYDGNLRRIDKYCQYLTFKMNCVREQEEIGIKFNVEHCQTVLNTLIEDKKFKLEELKKVMPQAEVKKKKVYEDAVEDENGNVFQKGDLFFDSIESTDCKKIEKTKVTGHKNSNPNSSTQLKAWLYSLGWVPEHIKHVRNKSTGETKKIEQISSKIFPGQICNSIVKLFNKEPKLEVLSGLALISHRIGIFEGFLKNQVDGRLYPSCLGLTNTLRLKHSVIVNLPGVDKKYGGDIRNCLIANEGEELCGSDLSNIEDRTKRHYIYDYDPQYVEEMNIEGYDAHLSIAILAGSMTEDEAEFYKWYEKEKNK